MKPANRLRFRGVLLALLFAFLIHAGGAAARGALAPDVAAAALDGAELGLRASDRGPAAAQTALVATPGSIAVAGVAPVTTPTSPPPPTPAPTPKDKVIVVDPGHGGSEIGAAHSGAGGEDLIEKHLNLAIALRLADMLRQAGYTVELTRTDDTRPASSSLQADLQARADLANRVGADLFVSIHHNGSDNATIRGTEVYYCAQRPFSAENRRLADLLQQALVRNIRQAGYDTVDRGVKDDSVIGHIAVLAQYNLARPTNMPGVLGEALFLSNESDAAALARPEVQEAIARGYFEAIEAYFS